MQVCIQLPTAAGGSSNLNHSDAGIECARSHAFDLVCVTLGVLDASIFCVEGHTSTTL